MNKLRLLIGSIILITCIGFAGCTTFHEIAESSLDDNQIDYKGPSPYPHSLNEQYFNLVYLAMEKFVNEMFWPFSELFYDKADDGTVYDPSQYAASNKPFAPSFFGALPSAPKGSSKISLMLSQGLEYVGKGGKENVGGVVTRTRLNYLEVPVMVNYFNRIAKTKSAYHLGVGPWVAYAFSGKYKTTGQSDVPVTFGPTGDFARLDYGAGLKAGIVFSKKWDISLGYDLGMRNLLGTRGAVNDGDKAHTRNISLSLGYWFR